MPARESTSSAPIEPDDLREILSLYCRALSGKAVEVQDTEKLLEKKIGWAHPGVPTTDGSTIFLPALARAANFTLLKVMATYQAAHIELGSFRFDFDRPAKKFRNLRPRWEKISARGAAPPAATDLGRFFRLFRDTRLALDVFTIVESARVEAALLREYRGLAPAYRAVRAAALASRPDIASLPAREAMVELLVRLSLGQTEALKIAARHARTARKMAGIVRRVAQPDAAVEDAAEATLRIYALLRKVPNEKIARASLTELGDTSSFANAGDEAGAGNTGSESQDDREKVPYRSPQRVDYRGDFMPELAELWSELAARNDETSSAPTPALTREQIAELVRNAPELKRGEPNDEAARRERAEQTLVALVNEAARRDPQNQEFRHDFMLPEEDDARPLAATRPKTFVYDEWDCHAGKYRPRWCLVHEKPMAYGDAAFYFQTLAQYRLLADRIRGEFEMLAPEMQRRVKRLEDGEEHDLDAFIEARIDLRAGASPTDKLYWRRHKTDRSVAALFLVDMSASTAEPIAEQEEPKEPPARAEWPPYRRIIDVEKEALVLLVNALEILGDRYGIYGFSGFGRDNVEFYIIKDIDEEFAADIPKRIDRIAPQHATRMGAAIRHAASKLACDEAKSKFLFLLSDGRPQDRGYSRDGLEKDYAVQDTRMALLEARREGIVPFCLTVDKSGHDYLHSMMADFSYEVLADVSLLPRRLPELYKKLTS
ncbi:MAG TPA: VWA domain-containing protein [Candidatus Acidoferrales bacterium]|nr:VWA domain-containing protein [Candidatus Acidoferrales bacterium]